MREHLNPKIAGTLDVDEVDIGHGAIVEAGAIIRGHRVVLGNFCFVGHGTKIFVDDFEMGDYTKLNAYSFAHGDQPMRIGRCCWIGGNVVLDSIGGLTIGNGVGIGSGSQLWTHIKFGDVVQGCRWNTHKEMVVGDDAWFVGHCLVSPVAVGERSMAMLGSVVTRDMEPNHVYAGVPARDITDKVGPQFADFSRSDKENALQKMLGDFYARHPEFRDWRLDCDVERRTYVQTLCEAEVAFFRENVPLVKLAPEHA